MHNALIHSGGWAPGYVVTQADLQAIDLLLFKSLNADDGGTWAPAALITIGGAGLAVSGPFTTSGSNLLSGGSGTSVGNTHQVTWLSGSTARFNSGATLSIGAGSTFTIGTSATFNASPTFVAGFSASAQVDITASGASNWDLHATVIVESDGSISVKGGGGEQIVLGGGICSVGSGATLTCAAGSTAAFSGTVTIGGTATVSCAAPITLSGKGHINQRPTYTLPTDADATIGVTSGGSGGNGADTVRLPNGVFTGDHNLTLTSTGAVAGSRILVVTDDGVHTLTLKNDNGVTIAQLKAAAGTGGIPIAAAGFHKWLELEHNGAANGWGSLRGLPGA